ncbi:hypothetical protein AgCh_037420 [Apium graveolens]
MQCGIPEVFYNDFYESYMNVGLWYFMSVFKGDNEAGTLPTNTYASLVAPVRLFATAPPATKGDGPPPTLKGDGVRHGYSKSCSRTFFLDAKKKFETARGVLRKEKITIDPEDPAAVSQYAEVMNTSVRELTIKYSIATQTAHIEDVRTHMLALKEIRINESNNDEDPEKPRRGLTVELGAEAMMMAASENVQKK